MKKLYLFCILCALSTASFFAQNKFRFGLKVAAQPSWLRSNDTKRVESSGAIFGYGFGLVLDWRLNDVAAISTGIGGEFDGGKQNFDLEDKVYYAANSDDEIIKCADVSGKDITGVSLYRLLNRDLRITTVALPITLKLSTKEIGGLKYFGQFGLNLGTIVKMRSTDEVEEIYVDGVGKSNARRTIEDFNTYFGVMPLRVGLNIGIGTEYLLSGSTSAYASINYIHQFINTFWEDTDYYANKQQTSSSNPPKIELSDRAKMSAFGAGVQINLGVMF